MHKRRLFPCRFVRYAHYAPRKKLVMPALVRQAQLGASYRVPCRKGRKSPSGKA